MNIPPSETSVAAPGVFKGARLHGADMRYLRVHLAELNGSEATVSTRWPSGFDPAAHGVRVVSEGT
jgi:hypothetical protein